MTMRSDATRAMVPAGEFLPRGASGLGRLGFAARLGIFALLVALVAASAAAAALLLWLVSVLLPVAIAAGLVAYAAFRIQVGTRGNARSAGI